MDQRNLNEILRHNPQTDFYATLGVAPNATEEEITKAHRKLSSALHPDKAGERFIASDPKLQRQYDAMLRGVHAEIDGLSAEELQARTAGKRQFEGRPPETVKDMLKRDAVGGVRADFLTSHEGKFGEFKAGQVARLQSANTAAEVLGDSSLRRSFDGHRAHVAAAARPAGGPQPGAQQNTGTAGSGQAGGGEAPRREPPRQETPRQEPRRPQQARQEQQRQEAPRSNAAPGGAGGAGGAGGGEPPRHGGGAAGAGPAESGHPHAAAAEGERKVRMPGRGSTLVKAFGALAAAAVVGTLGAMYISSQDKLDKQKESPIKERRYETVAQQMADPKAGGTERIFVEQALGVGGLTLFAGKQGGRELEGKTGLTVQQFNSVRTLFNGADVKASLTGQMKTPAQKASVTFVQAADGRFSVADPKAQRSTDEQAKFDALPKVTLNLDKDKVELVYDDPRTGKGPRAVEYEHSGITKAQLVQDQKARETAVSAAMDEVGAQRSAAAAAAEAAAKRTGGKPAP